MISALAGSWKSWAPEAAEFIMPTCGMSLQGLLAGAQSQKYKKSEREGKGDRGKD